MSNYFIKKGSDNPWYFKSLPTDGEELWTKNTSEAHIFTMRKGLNRVSSDEYDLNITGDEQIVDVIIIEK